MNEPQWTYQDIVNHFVKIIGNGTFTVETINESILLKMLDSKGIKIPVEKSYRDIDKDYKMHLQDIGITMNEPQLSAEMEIVTKFRQFLANWDYAHLTRKVSVEESRQMCDEFALTLATALEEQEKEYFEKINIKNKTIEHMMEEIRYLRSSQPARRKPIIRIKNGDRWYIPMITQAHDTPDGLYIEAELAILNGKE